MDNRSKPLLRARGIAAGLLAACSPLAPSKQYPERTLGVVIGSSLVLVAEFVGKGRLQRPAESSSNTEARQQFSNNEGVLAC